MRQVLNKYKLFLWTIKIPILLYAYPYNVKYILKMQNILDIILFEAYAEIRRRGKPPSSFNFILSFLPKERRIPMKQFFDERQTQTAEHLGTISFYVIFLVSITAILIQLTFFSAPLQNVLGETAAVLTGGLVYLSGCIKNGLWSSDKTKSSWRENLILSLVCSGIFSIFYGFAISRKASADTAIGKYVCFFFIGITLISFIVTTLLGAGARKQERKQEEKYSD